MLVLWKTSFVKEFPMIQNQFQMGEKQRFKIILRFIFYPQILKQQQKIFNIK